MITDKPTNWLQNKIQKLNSLAWKINGLATLPGRNQCDVAKCQLSLKQKQPFNEAWITNGKNGEELIANYCIRINWLFNAQGWIVQVQYRLQKLVIRSLQLVVI